MSFTRFLGGSSGGAGGNSGFSRFLSGNNSQDDEDEKLLSQIGNAKTRITDAGYEPEDTDKRNWFEKATNLPTKQNWFFDTLELLGRPGQAVKNVLDKGVGEDKVKSVGQAAWQGFSGKERVSGADLAERHMGLEGGFARFLGGTAIDIATDPLTYVPGGVLARGAKGAGSVVTKPIKAGYNLLETALPTVKNFREATIEPIAERVKDGLGYAFNHDYKIKNTLGGGESTFLKDLAQNTDNSRKIMQEDALERIGKTARDAGGLDTGTEVGRILEAPLKQFEDVKGYEFPDGLRRTTDKKEIFAEIGNTRQAVRETGKEINATKRQYNTSIGEFADGIAKTDNDIRKLYMSLERQSAKEVDAATRANLREAGKELARIESQLDSFGQNEESMLKYYKKLIAEDHESNFSILKKIRETAPNGIKGVPRNEMPNGARYLVRLNGKGIDEVASELGYKYADDLIQEIKNLDGVPRRLDDDTITSMARKEMERTGALRSLEDTRKQLESTKQILMRSIDDVQKTAPTSKMAKATEKAFVVLSQDERYIGLKQQRDMLKQQLDSIKGESASIKTAKIERIKQLENEIETLQSAAQNPVMIQKQIERPVRELSADPKVTAAAQRLMNSNNVIRQFAEENGISIKEMEGYMTHVLAAEERARRKVVKPVTVDRGSRNAGNPNKSVLKNRELMGSVEDVNDKLGRTFFEPNAYFATAIGQKRLIDFVHAVSFRRKVLSNPDFARPFVKGMDVPNDAVVIDVNQYSFIKPDGDLLEGLELADEIGGQYLVTKQTKNMLDRLQHVNTDEGTKSMIKAFDTTQTWWKRFALLSAGYHVRNMAGGMFNNYVGGMKMSELAIRTTQGAKEVLDATRGKESALFREFREQGLGSNTLSQVEFARFGEEPEKGIERTIKNLSKDTKGKVLQRLNPLQVFNTSQEAGSVVDQVNRFALYKWAKEKGMSAEQAAAKVREVQFDYSKLTPFEQKYVSRLVPFYRWMRNNIPFQIRQFINDPRKYEFLNKARLNAQDAVGIDEDNVPNYMKESFSVPVFGENGKGKMLGLNLPLGDMTKLSNPLKLGIDGLTPLLKTPMELGLNYNMFYGKPIEKFEGQQKQFVGGFEMPIKTAYALEQATGQIGRGLSGFLQKSEDKDQDTQFRVPSFGISSMLKDFDADKARQLELIQERKKLQDFLLYIEQQTGQKPRTVREIEKAAR